MKRKGGELKKKKNATAFFSKVGETLKMVKTKQRIHILFCTLFNIVWLFKTFNLHINVYIYNVIERKFPKIYAYIYVFF